jgi:Zn-dependent membrane protease YugP
MAASFLYHVRHSSYASTCSAVVQLKFSSKVGELMAHYDPAKKLLEMGRNTCGRDRSQLLYLHVSEMAVSHSLQNGLMQAMRLSHLSGGSLKDKHSVGRLIIRARMFYCSYTSRIFLCCLLSSCACRRGLEANLELYSRSKGQLA